MRLRLFILMLIACTSFAQRAERYSANYFSPVTSGYGLRADTSHGKATFSFVTALWSGGMQFNTGNNRSNSSIYIHDNQTASGYYQTTTPHGLLNVLRWGPSSYSGVDNINAAAFRMYSDPTQATQPGVISGIRVEGQAGGVNATDAAYGGAGGDYAPPVVMGIDANAHNYTRDTVLELYGIQSGAYQMGGGSTSRVEQGGAIFVRSFIRNVGTWGKSFGVKISDQTVATVNYAMWLGPIGKLTWNEDVGLWRTGAGALKTDGALQVDGVLSGTTITRLNDSIAVLRAALNSGVTSIDQPARDTNTVQRSNIATLFTKDVRHDDSLAAHRVLINSLANGGVDLVARESLLTHRDNIGQIIKDLTGQGDTLVVHKNQLKRADDSLTAHKNQIKALRDTNIVLRSNMTAVIAKNKTQDDTLTAHRNQFALSVGTGAIVRENGPSLASPVIEFATIAQSTLEEPAIADFVSAQHNHTSATQGGNIPVSATTGLSDSLLAHLNWIKRNIDSLTAHKNRIAASLDSIENLKDSVALALDLWGTRRVYRAIVAQSGTSTPTKTTVVNTIGALALTRADVGDYRFTLTGAFTGATLFGSPVVVVNTDNVPAYVTFSLVSNDVLKMSVTNASGSAIDLKSTVPIEFTLH